METRDAPVADRRLEIETPEHVAVAYDLAGPGSRFTAFLFDASLLGLALLGTWIAGGAVMARLSIQPVVPYLAAVYLAATFAAIWGYFIAFEGLRDGQTPGKRWMGLRVVHDGGHPVSVRGAAVRNLVRLIDIQPMPACLLGGAMILLHPRAQRLGDIAAGTIVVRERRGVEGVSAGGAREAPRLSEEQFEVLAGYVSRRDELERRAREGIAQRIAPHLLEAIEDEGVRRDIAERHYPAREIDLLLVRMHAAEAGRRAFGVPRAERGSATAAALVRRQRPVWAEYGGLVDRARKGGLASLPEQEVSRFAALYREVAADLARARTYGAPATVLVELEQAVGAGHNLLYTRQRGSLRPVGEWLAGGLPRLVRRLRRPILAAAVLLFLPGVIAFAAIALEPEHAYTLLPAATIAHAESGEAREDAGAGYAQVPEMAMPLFSSQIITNNVQVAFGAFAGGVLAGLGTILVLLFNGVHIGAVFGLYHAEGLNLQLWSFVLPHAVLELTAICLAGGAGLWLGSAILVPGRVTRQRALTVRAREAVTLLFGAVLILVAAGLIEGFVSPAPLPFAVKLGVAALTASTLFPYLILAGRRPPEPRAERPPVRVDRAA